MKPARMTVVDLRARVRRSSGHGRTGHAMAFGRFGFLALLALAVSGALAACAAPPPVYPTVNLTAPVDGATVSGITTLSADASENIDHVSFRVDGNTVGTDSEAPYSYDWDSTSVSNGSHSITALAVDTSGNSTATPDTTVTVNNAPPPTLQQVDGGTDYYSRFADPLPTAPEYFPIGVWGAFNQTQANMDLDAKAGINTYVWAADTSFLPAIRADGRFRVIEDTTTNTGSETAGWLLSDEDDMSDTATCPNALNQEKAGYPSDGRIRYANFGKGLAKPGGANIGDFENWWATAAEQQCWTNGVDLDSVDLYWFTDPFEDPNMKFGYLYGDNIRHLRHADASDGVMHPHWGFVETGWPSSESAAQGARAILPDEMRSAVWHQMIAGARGLVWFVHSFGGPHAGDPNTLRSNSEGTRAMATAIDDQLKSLAPVLNAPNVTDSWTMSGDVEASVKWSGGHFYVMAGAKTGATSATFSMPCVGDATATRLAPSNEPSEAASIPMGNGSFTDSFADKNSVHIYRLDGGSNCGLTAG